MDTGHNFQLPKVRKSLDIVLTALGISLFVAFAAMGARQADDRRIVTGNNEQKITAEKDVELTAAGDETYAPYAISTKPDIRPSQTPPSDNKPVKTAQPQAQAVEKASVKNRGIEESRIRQN